MRLEARELGQLDLTKPNIFIPVHNIDFGQKSKKNIAELEVDNKLKNELEDPKCNLKHV